MERRCYTNVRCVAVCRAVHERNQKQKRKGYSSVARRPSMCDRDARRNKSGPKSRRHNSRILHVEPLSPLLSYPPFGAHCVPTNPAQQPCTKSMPVESSSLLHICPSGSKSHCNSTLSSDICDAMSPSETHEPDHAAKHHGMSSPKPSICTFTRVAGSLACSLSTSYQAGKKTQSC